MMTEGTPNGWFFYVVMLLIVLSFRRKKTVEYEDLGRECTKELKGFAILTVLLGHLAHLFGMISMPVTDYLGAQGVEIFLFLSGFGLTASFYEKGLKGFWKKRLLTIYVPYTVVNVLKVGAMLCIYGFAFFRLFGVPQLLLNFLGLNIMMDTSMWYIQYILLCYLIFFLVVYFCRFSRPGVTAALFFVFFLVGFVLNGWQMGTDAYLPFMECYSHYLSFPLGMLGFVLYERMKRLPTFSFPVGSGVFLLLFLFSSSRIPDYAFYLLSNITFVLFAVTLFIWLTRMKLHSRLLEKLGDLGFHIYLNEYVVMMLVSMMYYNSGFAKLDRAVPTLIILAVSVAVAIVTKKLSDLCLGKLKN